MRKIPEAKQYEHKTLFHYYYQDLNGEWTRCNRFSLRDLWYQMSYGDESSGCNDYKRNTPFHHYHRETNLSDKDFILKRVFVPLYVMVVIIVIVFVVYILTR